MRARERERKGEKERARERKRRYRWIDRERGREKGKEIDRKRERHTESSFNNISKRICEVQYEFNSNGNSFLHSPNRLYYTVFKNQFCFVS